MELRDETPNRLSAAQYCKTWPKAVKLIFEAETSPFVTAR